MTMELYDSKTYMDDVRWAAGSVPRMAALDGARVLVTGASGLIGSFLVDVLGCLGARVVAAGRNVSRLRERFDASPFELEIVALDVSRSVSLDANVDYVIHAASSADPASMLSDPVGLIGVNVGGTGQLLGWAQTHGCRRFIYVSSGEVYGQIVCSDAFTESQQGYVDPRQVRSCYPLAKRMAENLCVCWTRQYGMETASARLCHTYGPTARESDVRASSAFAWAAARGESVVMTGPGTQVRSYLHVVDAVSGILSVLCAERPMCSCNVASVDSVVTVRKMGESFAVAGGVPFEVVPLPAGSDATPIVSQILDSTELMSLGWRPFYSMGEGAVRTVKALREGMGC